MFSHIFGVYSIGMFSHSFVKKIAIKMTGYIYTLFDMKCANITKSSGKTRYHAIDNTAWADNYSQKLESLKYTAGASNGNIYFFVLS